MDYKEKTAEDCLRIDPETNALDFLEDSIQFLILAEKEPLKWKGVIVSLHGALYGFCISALKGTDPSRVEVTKNGKTQIINFWTALKRCKKNDWMKQYGHSQALRLSEEDEDSIREISKRLRNNFEHFPSLSWEIEILLIVQNLGIYFRFIEFLVLESGNINPLDTFYFRNRVKFLCEAGRALLKIHEEHLKIVHNFKEEEEEARRVMSGESQKIGSLKKSENI